MNPEPEKSLPRVVCAGEALTDFIRIDADRWLARAGGAPWNVARVLATLGVSSAFAGGVSADPLGEELIRLSREAGLDMRFTQQHAKSPLLAMVHETTPPRYFFIGEDSADLAFDPSRLPPGWVEAVEWLHVGSISLTREPLRGNVLALVDTVKRAGKRVSFDPNFRNLMDERYDVTLRAVASRADLIKVSDEDLRGLFRTRDLDDALAQLRAVNPVAPLLLTRGADGAELHVDSVVLKQASPAVRVIDTVGAGDASVAGFLYSLLRHARTDWASHLRCAVAAGAAACGEAGATPPSHAALERILHTMEAGKK